MNLYTICFVSSFVSTVKKYTVAKLLLFMVSPEGFEPSALGLKGRCSTRLSYGPTLEFFKNLLKILVCYYMKIIVQSQKKK